MSYHRLHDRWPVRAVEWLLFALAWCFRAATWPVPTWALGNALAPVGALLVELVPGARRRVMGNLGLVWPERSARERRAILREAGRQFMRLMIEYAHLDRWAREVRIEASGLEHLAAALTAGRGAVIVTAHYGNWEAVRLAALRAGHPVGIIYRAFNNRYLDRYTLRLITATGTPILQKGRHGVRQMLGLIAGGGAIMVLVDQRTSGAPFLPFLGRPAETVLVAAELASRSGAALIPAVARRDVAGRRFAVRFEPPLPDGPPAERMAAANARIGAWIEEEPGQWFWFHQRWKTTARSRG